MTDFSNATHLSDMQIPESWASYIIERSTASNAFFQSGVVADNTPALHNLGTSGTTVNIPAFQPLEVADPQVPTDTADLVLNKIKTDKFQARKLGFDQAWSATDLSRELSGADPLGAIGDSIADYWNTIYEKVLLAELTGMFASTSMKGVNQLDVTSTQDPTFSLTNFNKARFMLGDRYKDLALVVIHSDILMQLQNANIVDPKTGATNTFVINGNANVPTSITAPDTGDSIKGVQIVVDDALTKDASGKYNSYLFAKGAVSYVELPVENAVETGREPLINHGVDYLINRRRFVMQPQGISWNDTAFGADKEFPDLTDLANGANWTKKFDNKLIPMVKFTTTDGAIITASTTAGTSTSSTSSK